MPLVLKKSFKPLSELFCFFKFFQVPGKEPTKNIMTNKNKAVITNSELIAKLISPSMTAPLVVAAKIFNGAADNNNKADKGKITNNPKKYTKYFCIKSARRGFPRLAFTNKNF